ncbi:hypothetical protein [Nocardia gipuzkoensis]|uniref:hypothetical protein n=1 Tax=Nocardia gipuzkoensis TaxID=2749991 RepID=UPI0015EFD75F|nr:hypothetical protein [Nocardia gipuzkoensis]
MILYLQDNSSNTRVVLFNEVADSVRVLFNIAAMRWLGAWGMMTKGAAADGKALASVARGVLPTPEAWRRGIRQHGFLIDGLFERPEWLDIWPLWRKFRSRADAVLRAHPEIAQSEYRLRTFAEGTRAAVEALEASVTTTLKGPLDAQNTRGTAQCSP